MSLASPIFCTFHQACYTQVFDNVRNLFTLFKLILKKLSCIMFSSMYIYIQKSPLHLEPLITIFNQKLYQIYNRYEQNPTPRQIFFYFKNQIWDRDQICPCLPWPDFWQYPHLLHTGAQLGQSADEPQLPCFPPSNEILISYQLVLIEAKFSLLILFWILFHCMQNFLSLYRNNGF